MENSYALIFLSFTKSQLSYQLFKLLRAFCWQWWPSVPRLGEGGDVHLLSTLECRILLIPSGGQALGREGRSFLGEADNYWSSVAEKQKGLPASPSRRRGARLLAQAASLACCS